MKTAYIVILTLAAGLAARADFSYSMTRKSTGGQMGPMAASAIPQVTKHYLKGQKMKIDHGGTATVIDFDAQTITSLNPNQKTYTVTKFSDLGQALKQSDVDVKIDVKKTGEVKTINGYSASEVVMTMDVDNPQARQAGMKMQMEMHMWVSPDVPGSGEMRTFYERNGSHFPWAALTGGGNTGMQKAMTDLQRQMSSMHGVPVLQVMKMKPAGAGVQAAQQQGMAEAMARLEEMKKQGGPQAKAAEQALARMGAMSGGGGSLFEMTMESGDFSTAAIPDAVFAVPAGYQRAEKK